MHTLPTPYPCKHERTGFCPPSPSGQNEGPRCVVGLQAAQELPGFLLHEELVFGAPTGHRLPGTGHLRGSEMVSSVQTQVVLTSKSRDVSRTSLSMLEASLCSLYFLGRPREAMPHLWALTVKQSRRLGQEKGGRSPGASQADEGTGMQGPGQLCQE